MACAIAPTANGTEDAPDAPIAEQIPTAGTCNDFGRTVVRLTIIAGNNGPRKKPVSLMSLMENSCGVGKTYPEMRR